MGSPFMIRRVGAEDLAALKDLDEIVFGHLAYPYFVLRQIFDSHQGELLVVEESGMLLGYSIAVSTTTPQLGWFLALGVDPAYRCRGLGWRLAHASIALLRDGGVRRIQLSVDGKNVAAVALYRKLGFQVIGDADDYLGPGEPRRLLELTLDNQDP